MRRGRHGFTLIELLVVIAIIAILAAILFPVFVSAKRSALESKCINNLKQIGTAMNLYMSDSNDRYPCYMAYLGDATASEIDNETMDPSAVGLARILNRYSKTGKGDIWMCPGGAKRLWGAPACTIATIRPHLVGWTILKGGVKVSSNYFSYPLNIPPRTDPNLPPYDEFCQGWTPVEAMQKWGNYFSPTGAGWAKGYRQPLWNNRLIQDAYQINPTRWRPHKGGTNILFHGGHVKFVKDFRPSTD